MTDDIKIDSRNVPYNENVFYDRTVQYKDNIQYEKFREQGESIEDTLRKIVAIYSDPRTDDIDVRIMNEILKGSQSQRDIERKTGIERRTIVKRLKVIAKRHDSLVK